MFVLDGLVQEEEPSERATRGTLKSGWMDYWWGLATETSRTSDNG